MTELCPGRVRRAAARNRRQGDARRGGRGRRGARQRLLVTSPGGAREDGALLWCLGDCFPKREKGFMI